MLSCSMPLTSDNHLGLPSLGKVCIWWVGGTSRQCLEPIFLSLSSQPSPRRVIAETGLAYPLKLRDDLIAEIGF